MSNDRSDVLGIRRYGLWYRVAACLLIGVAVVIAAQPRQKPTSAAPRVVFAPTGNGNTMTENSNLELATFGAGCFWCVEAVFEQLKGVEWVRSGYSGGGLDNPSYEQVCSGRTGHAEVIQIGYDPSVISFEDLLEVFFSVHDPTTLNRQGNDVGTQYRSAVFYHSPEQQELATQTIEKWDAAKEYPAPIVTEVTEFKKFYSAEDYHQGYFRAHGRQPYCMMVVSPKVAKFRSKFADRLKE